MAQASCPTCFHRLDVPDCLAFGLLRCPGCQVAYSYQPATTSAGTLPSDLQAWMPSAELLASILAEPPRPPQPEPVPEPPAEPPPEPEAIPDGPALIGQHICQHCMRELRFSIGQKAATPRCPGCRNKTSVYAVQFRCPHCHDLLESPRRLGGQTRPCPQCQKDVCIPRLILEDEADGADDLEAFVCDCPSCDRRVVTRRDEVGRPGVCPLCHVIITVPAHGSRSPQPGPRPRGHNEGDHEERHLTCRSCGSSVPVALEHCPSCGEANRRSQYP